MLHGSVLYPARNIAPLTHDVIPCSAVCLPLLLITCTTMCYDILPCRRLDYPPTTYLCVVHLAWPQVGWPTVLTALPACCWVVCTTVNFQDEPPPGKDSVEGIAVQQRCEVQPGGRRGVVEFVGEVEGLQVRKSGPVIQRRLFCAWSPRSGVHVGLRTECATCDCQSLILGCRWGRHVSMSGYCEVLVRVRSSA